MLQIFSRWRCDNWVSVFKIIFTSLGLLLYQNQKFHEQHDKNIYHPKNHTPRIYEYVIEFDRLKNLELFIPAYYYTLNNSVVAKRLKKYLIFTCGGGLHYRVSPILLNWSYCINKSFAFIFLTGICGQNLWNFSEWLEPIF